MEWQVDMTAGNFTVEATGDGMRSRIIDKGTGKVVKTFSGETAWSDARREATDYALRAMYA